MNRKSFIVSLGATCRNWTWSWSFVDDKNKKIIFGAWDVLKEDGREVILKESWERSEKNKVQNGYVQALEHIDKIVNEGYLLYTFPIQYSEKEDNSNVAVINGFTPELNKRFLIKEETTWYACEDNFYPEQINKSISLSEGAKSQITINSYERNPIARMKCIEIHGCKCKACGFDFEKTYGILGKGFIHVHHLKPLSTIAEEYIIDPEKDLIPLCPNCHAMVHRKLDVLSLEQIIDVINANRIS